MCSKRHALDEVVRIRQTEEQWPEVIDTMMSYGVQGTDQEIRQVFQLVGNFLKEPPGQLKTAALRKVKVNRASAKEISTVMGLSPADAEAIVGWREKNGNSEELLKLGKVPGINNGQCNLARSRRVYILGKTFGSPACRTRSEIDTQRRFI